MSGIESLGASRGASPSQRQLTPEQTQEVRELQKRDSEVRQHERAHKAAAGGQARGGPSFQFTTGPDGRRYATGGEVQIDTSEATSPAATVRKLQAVRRAALAPASPSPQDRRVAAEASAKLAAAQREISSERREDRPTGNHVDLVA